MHLLGEEYDAVTMKKFMKAAEERVIVVHPDGTVDDFFEGFFRAFEGNSSLLANLDDPLHSIAGYSDGAKARLRFFLSDPDAGELWKLDDYAPGDTESWKRYISRGVLGELDIYKRIYKPQGFGHSPTAAGFDFDGSAWVQIKTCKNPASNQNIADMKSAITDLVTAAGNSQDPLILHILKKPGVDSGALNSALIQYRVDQGLDNRLQILIEAYNIGPL